MLCTIFFVTVSSLWPNSASYKMSYSSQAKQINSSSLGMCLIWSQNVIVLPRLTKEAKGISSGSCAVNNFLPFDN